MDRFAGAGTPLTGQGLSHAASDLAAQPASLWALLAVETAGCGYRSDRRPKILFEHHIFHRLTGGRFDSDDPDISAPIPGGYGAGGAHQYVRLTAALHLDREAALSSASGGLGQILGVNHVKAGYRTVGDMVDAFVAAEDAQLAGMTAIIASTGIASAVARKRWADYARLYNGADCARNRYDERLQLACAHYETAGCPDVDLRAAQVYLGCLGVDTGGVDGIKGPKTTNALRSFQKSAALATTGLPDEPTLTALKAKLG